jgi:hypothetical protein
MLTIQNLVVILVIGVIVFFVLKALANRPPKEPPRVEIPPPESSLMRIAIERKTTPYIQTQMEP